MPCPNLRQVALLAVSQVYTRDRAAVATAALHQRLEEWGLATDEAQSILCHDIRCLRALGASLSHGPISIMTAQAVITDKHLHPFVDAAAAAIPNEMLASLAGPKRPEAKLALEDGNEPTPHRRGLFRRLLSIFLGNRGKG